jgi:hypothetical protein
MTRRFEHVHMDSGAIRLNHASLAYSLSCVKRLYFGMEPDPMGKQAKTPSKRGRPLMICILCRLANGHFPCVCSLAGWMARSFTPGEARSS